MAKYCWIFLWQILYFCTVIVSWTWSREIDLNNPTCANNEFGYKSPNGQLKCQPCRPNLPKCPNGLGVSVACGHIAHTHVHCVNCVLGKNFSAEYDRLPCETCQSAFCHENEKIVGSCTVDKDTSKCSGTCKKGFYSSDGDLKNCQRCSSCLNNASARVKKCKDDGLLIEKQCEVGSVVPPAFPSKKQLSSKKNGEKHCGVEGYKVYGHPVLFGFFLFVILVLILAVFVLRRKFRKKTQSPVVALTEVTSNDDSGVGETDQYDGSSYLPAVEAGGRRKSSSGSAGRKVSFSRQVSSNSNNGSDLSDERPGSAHHSSVVVNELSGENDVFEEKPQAPGRKRTISSSSAGKIRQILGRQNSVHKTGTKEETTSLLSSTDYNDNDIPPQVVELLPETSSSKGIVIAAHRLSGLKVGELNAETHRQLCTKLNLDLPNKDWRTLAGRMKYNHEEVQEFAWDENPAKKLLDCWGTGEGHDVACLIELVKAMDRNDLVELLES